MFQIKYAEAIFFSNSTRKLLWFEITKMLIAFKKNKFIVIYYNFRHTFVPYWCIGVSTYRTQSAFKTYAISDITLKLEAGTTTSRTSNANPTKVLDADRGR